MNCAIVLLAIITYAKPMCIDYYLLRKAYEHHQVDIFTERLVNTKVPQHMYWQKSLDFGWRAVDVNRGFYDKKSWELTTLRLPNRKYAIEQKIHPDIIINLQKNSQQSKIQQEVDFHYSRGSSVAFPAKSALQVAATTGLLEYSPDETWISFIFSNGGIKVPPPRNSKGRRKDYYASGYFFCDGDFKLPRDHHADSLHNSTIVCRGDVLLPRMIGMCTVYATGDIYLPDECSLGQCVLHAGGIIHLPKKYDIGEKCTMKQKMADPLKPYSFFEIKQIGIDLEGRVLNAKIMVNLIDKTSPFHELLKAHDHITHVDGVAITTVEDTRKLFRSGYAKGYTTLTRLREGKSAEVKVSYFDK